MRIGLGLMSDNTSSRTPTDQEVVAALEQTGFLLEQRVAKCLRDYEFHTEINHAYPDPESGESREIDVLASIFEDIQHGQLDALLAVDLIVECKNTPAPFVLVGETIPNHWFSDPAFLSFDPLTLQFPRASGRSVWSELGLRRLRPPSKDEEFIGNQLVRMNLKNRAWRADNNAIYDSILYPLTKAKDYQWKSITEGNDYGAKPWENPCPYLAYLIPVIVTAGPIYTVDAVSDDAKVSRVKWARLRRDFRTKEASSDLAADLVSFEHLAEYIEKRPVDLMKRAVELLSKNLHLYDPKWLLANFGSPADVDTFERWQADIVAP
jgi:hypothetical protein